MPTGAIMAVSTVAAGAIGANAQSKAAKNAAKAQTAAADQANATQLAIYNDQRGLLAPSITAGANAEARQMLMLGYTPDEVKQYLSSTASAVSAPAPGTITPSTGTSGAPATGGQLFLPTGSDRPQPDGGSNATGGTVNHSTGATGAATTPTSATSGAGDYSWVDSYDPQSFLESSPGYQFQLGQGEKAVDRGAAARGRLFSGATGEAEQRYGQDYASNYWDRLFGQYGSLAGQGQQSTGTTVNVAGQYGDAASQNDITAGNARASAYTAAGNAWGNFWGSTVPGGIGSLYGADSKAGWFGG